VKPLLKASLATKGLCFIAFGGTILNLLCMVAGAVVFNRDLVPIAATSDKGWVTISVSDQGPLLSLLEVSKTFARYRETASEQGRDTSKERQDLDLVICRSLIDLHGGKIWAVGEVDKGTSFLFSVPDEKIPKI
jgi:signal transduction histidine kinase